MSSNVTTSFICSRPGISDLHISQHNGETWLALASSMMYGNVWDGEMCILDAYKGGDLKFQSVQSDTQRNVASKGAKAGAKKKSSKGKKRRKEGSKGAQSASNGATDTSTEAVADGKASIMNGGNSSVYPQAGPCLAYVETRGGSSCVRFLDKDDSSDAVAVAGDEGVVRLFKASELFEGSETPSDMFQIHAESVLTMDVCNADRELIVTGCHDHSVRVFNANSMAAFTPFVGHLGAVWSACWRRKDQLNVFATASQDRTIRLWDSGRESACVGLLRHNAPILSLDWSSNDGGHTIVFGDSSGNVCSCDVRNLSELLAKPVLTLPDSINAVKLFNGEQLAAGSEDGSIALCDITASSEVKILNAHNGRSVHALQWADAQSLFSAAWDGTVCNIKLQKQQQ